jgi:hypothetical protein
MTIDDLKNETMILLGKKVAEKLNIAITPSPMIQSDKDFGHLGRYIAAAILELGWYIQAPEFKITKPLDERVKTHGSPRVQLRLIEGGARSKKQK